MRCHGCSDSRKRLSDEQVREYESKKAIRSGDVLCLCRKTDDQSDQADDEAIQRDSWAGYTQDIVHLGGLMAAQTAGTIRRRAGQAVTA